MSKGNYEDFLEAVRKRESSGNYAIQNPLGFSGAYQMGEPALQDAGFYNKDGTAKNDFKGKWTDKAHDIGVNNISDFLGAENDGTGQSKTEVYGKRNKKRIIQDPLKTDTAKKAQDEAIKAYYIRVWGYICSAHLDRYVGETIKGIKLTESALIGGYHLVGRGYTNKKTKKRVPGLEDYLKSSGTIDPTDANKTHISEYIKLFNDYQVPFKKRVGVSKSKKPKHNIYQKRISVPTHTKLKHKSVPHNESLIQKLVKRLLYSTSDRYN
jgi:hypothetical protein